MLTDAQVAELGGGKKTFPVRVTVNGTVLSLRLARMGGENLIGLARAAREQAKVEIGATVEVEIELDAAERTVEVPTDLAEALAADPQALAAFSALSYAHRKEYVRWVEEAKKAETRADRVGKTVERAKTGQPRGKG
ncbi:MAG: YdeI/OmpD-associated family protein [Myxococcota bacterium]